MKKLSEALKYALPRTIPQTLLLASILYFVDINVYINIVLWGVIIIVPLYRNIRIYLSIAESIDVIDNIRRSDNPIFRIEG